MLSQGGPMEPDAEANIAKKVMFVKKQGPGAVNQKVGAMTDKPAQDQETAPTATGGDSRLAWERPVLLRLGASEAEYSAGATPDYYVYDS